PRGSQGKESRAGAFRASAEVGAERAEPWIARLRLPRHSHDQVGRRYQYLGARVLILNPMVGKWQAIHRRPVAIFRETSNRRNWNQRGPNSFSSGPSPNGLESARGKKGRQDRASVASLRRRLGVGRSRALLHPKRLANGGIAGVVESC